MIGVRMRQERGMDNAPYFEQRVLLPASQIAQNNPESEYKQYCTQMGAECELATKLALRPTVRGG